MEGNFDKGKPHGKCKLIVLDSNEEVYHYDGEWNNGVKEGSGV